MARKSRKNTSVANAGCSTQQASSVARIFKTAIYARLSVKTGRSAKTALQLTQASRGSGKQSKDTIENQIEIVSRYIDERLYLQLCAIYQDNGRTGTHFGRKGFVKMMDAVKRGDIDCIVVKDLSRFGRNYIETSDYLEKIFPFCGTRFISVNDNYDNYVSDYATGHGGLLISIRSLMDDVYAKDISRKTLSSIESRQRRGDFIGLYAAYGYVKSPVDKTKLVIDKDTAPVVRDIFDWKLAGLSNVAIARRLNEIGISAPNRYRYEKGILKGECHAKGLWQQQTIKAILRNPVYIGCLSQGKSKQRLYQGLKNRRRVSSDEWLNIPDSHAAIIDKSVFDTIGEIMDSISSAYNAKNATPQTNGNSNTFNISENILRRIVRCGDCGRNMVRDKETSKARADGSKKVRNVFICQRYEQLREQGCGSARKYISEKVLHEAVWTAVKAQMDLYADVVSLISKVQAGSRVKSNREIINTYVQEAQNKITRLDSLLLSLYDDFSEGVLAQDEYLFAKQKFMREKGDLKQRVDELTAMLTTHNTTYVEDNRWVSNISRFANQKELTRDMLTTLIDHICISERDNVHIIFNFSDELQALLGYACNENENNEVNSQCEVMASV